MGLGSDDVPLGLITLLMLRHALGWGSDDVPLDLITFLDSTIKSARKTFVYTNIYICLYLYIYIYRHMDTYAYRYIDVVTCRDVKIFAKNEIEFARELNSRATSGPKRCLFD